MLKRGRIGEGWLGELYAGEDVQGRPVRFSSLEEWSDPQRQWLLERMRLMNLNFVQGSCPHLGVQVIQGEACWVGAWRDAVQLSVVLDNKHIPNTVIMAVAFGILQSLRSAELKGLAHGVLHPNAIWLGLDGEIWIDGYGYMRTSNIDSATDVYEVGRLLIEMFLGNCPFPVSPEKHSQTLIDVGLELKAMGLPTKLPRQIVRLVHLDPEKRPSLDILVQKWKLTRGKQIIGSWVRSQFPQLILAHRPEDRIPTAQRISPLPFPKELYEDSIAIPQQFDFESIDPLLDDLLDPLLDDDTAIRTLADIASGYSEDDQTQELPPLDDSTEIASEERIQDVEETQAIQFLESFEVEFFDFEPTSRLVVDTPLIESEVLAIDEVDLSSEMGVPSRRPLMGLLWIGVVGMLTVVGLYWTTSNVPAYPEEASTNDALEDSLSIEDSKPLSTVAMSGVVETTSTELPPLDDSTEIASQEKSNVDGSTSVAENPVDRKAAKSSSQPTNSTQEKRSNGTKPSKKSGSSKEKESSRPSKSANVQSTDSSKRLSVTPEKGPTSISTQSKGISKGISKDTTGTEGTVTENWAETLPDAQKATPTPEVSPSKELEEKVSAGTVVLKGDAQSLRLEHKGRDVQVGSLSPGKYDVYVTFEGFSEFKVTTLNVEADGKYTLLCNSMFATCQVR
jgi:hypothetical protein